MSRLFHEQLTGQLVECVLFRSVLHECVFPNFSGCGFVLRLLSLQHDKDKLAVFLSLWLYKKILNWLQDYFLYVYVQGNPNSNIP